MGIIKLGINGELSVIDNIDIKGYKEYTYVRFYNVECVIVSLGRYNGMVNPYSEVFGSLLYGDIYLTKYDSVEGFNKEELNLVKLSVGNRYKLQKTVDYSDIGYVSLDHNEVYSLLDVPLNTLLDRDYSTGIVSIMGVKKYVILYEEIDISGQSRKNLTASKLLRKPIYGKVLFSELDGNILGKCDSFRTLKNNIQNKTGGVLGDYYNK